MVFNEFVLRTPALPFNFINKFINSEEDLVEYYFANQLIQEAIYISSPILYNELLKLGNGVLKKSNKSKKLIFPLAKYLLRMSSRTIPFGFFAGCSVGKISKKFNTSLHSINSLNKIIQLDISIVYKIACFISNLSIVRSQIRYYPNNTIYRIGNNLNYLKVDFNVIKEPFQIHKVSYNEIINNILSNSTNGLNIQELTNLVAAQNISINQINSYISNLIDSQLLVSEIDLNMTGFNSFQYIIKFIERLESKDIELIQVEKVLVKINKILISLKDVKTINRIHRYDEIYDLLNLLPIGVEKDNLFYADLINSNNNLTIKEEIANEIGKVINVIALITREQRNSAMDEFIKVFSERYQEEEIPLAIALDPELGIGYPVGNTLKNSDKLWEASILNNNLSIEKSINWTYIDSFLLKILLSSIKENKYEINLEQTEIYKHLDRKIKYPETLAIRARLINLSNDNNEYCIILKDASAFAAKLISRFGVQNSEIYELTKEIIISESLHNPQALFAELVCLPGLKEGNIIQRPSILDFEIPYISKSVKDRDFQIHISDLLISIKSNQVVLKSKSHNKEIYPRHNSIHYHPNSTLPIYRFLCDFQYRNVEPSFSFQWGVIENHCKFLPRVVYNKIILSLASWRLVKRDFIEIFDLNNLNKLLSIKKLRQELGIPRFVTISELDRHLAIDLESPICLEILIAEIKKLGNDEYIKINEFLIGEENLNFESSEPFFINEFILSYYRNSCISANQVTQDTELYPENTYELRSFIPGDEWVYYNLYCEERIAEEVLIAALKPVTEVLLSKNIIDKWFFIKYSDPCYHLRIRFHLVDLTDFSKVIHEFKTFLTGFIIDKKIWKVEIDTYKRELERYGVSSINFAEFIFFIDSKAMLSVIETISHSKNNELRWIIGIKNVDKLLTDFHLDLFEKEVFTFNLVKDFDKNNILLKGSKIKLNEKYRHCKIAIKDIVSTTNQLTPEFWNWNSVLNYRSFEISQNYTEITRLCHRSQILEYLKSYVHMSLNRLFLNKTSFYEYVVYFYLNKYYKSEIIIITNS